MQLWTKLSSTEVENIANDVGVRAEVKDEEVITRGPNKDKNKIHFVLFPKGDTYRKISLRGIPWGQKERRVNAVCWHGHFEFMQQLFLDDPDARLKTAIADYRGANGFLEEFPATGYKNIGSQMYPIQYRESCNCFSEGLDLICTKPLEDITHEVEFSEISSEGITAVKTLKQSSMLACPYAIMMPEHYREDETCRCDDPTHTKMGEWGYIWTGSKWE